MKTGKEAGIARILVTEDSGEFHRERSSSPRTRAGMGTLVGPCRVVTCAHVVNTALGEPKAKTKRPTRSVDIVFPLAVDPTAIFKASVKEWFPVNHPTTPDVAVLELGTDAPCDVGFAVFGVIQSRLDADELSVFGAFGGQAAENHVSTNFVGPTRGSHVQLTAPVRNSDPARRPAFATNSDRIGEGFSGASVWDVFHEVSIGMVTRYNEDAEEIAYMIPAANLLQAWPELPTEIRRLPRSVEAIWNALAFALSAAMFYFMVSNRRAVEGQEDLLSPFWGLHFYAFLAPVVGCVWFMYARDFKLHDWSSRVPRFLAIPFERGTAAAKISAAIILLVFVISLFWIEGHFINVFYSRGTVYIYPDMFGFKPEELQGCIPRDTPLCPHPAAGRYSLVSPRPPAPGGYWDNAYHYGGNKNGTTVTFFPILQPLVLQGFALFAVLVQIAALVRTFRRGDWPIVPFAILAFWRRRPAAR